MSASNDPDHFFQTSSSLAETDRKARKAPNTHGDPIRLSSKILAVIADPTFNGAVYLAESAGTARRVVLDTGAKNEVFRSPASTAPLTSLALSPPSAAKPRVLYAASWDKSIHSWDLATRAPARRFVGGHTDFVKCIVTTRLRGKELLLSGGADAAVVVWDLETGNKVQVLKSGHSRGILDMVLDPESPAFLLSTPVGEEEEIPRSDEGHRERGELQEQKQAGAEIRVFTASSDRTIRRFALTFSSPASTNTANPFKNTLPYLTETQPEDPIIAHETSINALHFPSFSDESDLWTASADGTAKCLSRSQSWESDTELPHGDYVRAVVVDDIGGWVITAGRSEEVKVWDKATGKIHHTYSGHFDEVTGLVLMEKRAEIVSVAIDGTVRRWSLKKEDLAAARSKAAEEAEKRERGEDIVDDNQGDGEAGSGKTAQEAKEGLLTEEEERELAELMEDD
ncbi:hypothetical protein G7Y79_00070g096890 [Physcia stellaris]|nr:hypothetical protein G7Y79_00070g096890 [Physcia stellaris]